MLPDTGSASGTLMEAERVARTFELNSEDAARMARYFVKQMKSGLNSNGGTQIPSFVTNIPNGTENGIFLAVDLGGTNCRVCSVSLHGDTTYTTIQARHTIPRHVMINADHKPLFNLIAEKIKEFLSENPQLSIQEDSATGVEKIRSKSGHLKLGFSFSFTYTSHSLSSGTLIQWDKGWDLPSALGKDPCKLLQDAVDELHLPVLVSALTNDSVGTLMARAYCSPWKSATLMGAIFGTGTNAAYVECLHKVKKLQMQGHDSDGPLSSQMVINTEWGAWLDEDSTLSPPTPYDDLLDQHSSNPKRQLLEKRVSGLYLGELARLALLQLTEAKLFDMSLSECSPIHKQQGITTSFLTVVAGKSSLEGLEEVKVLVCDALKARDISSEDARAICLVASAVLRRAARLSGAAIAAVIMQSGRMARLRGKTNGSASVIADQEIYKPSPMASGFPSIALLLQLCLYKLSEWLGIAKGDYLLLPIQDAALPAQEEDMIDIGVDGRLFESYPLFEEEIREVIREVPEIGPEGEAKLCIELTKDGSSVGAALVAQSI